MTINSAEASLEPIIIDDPDKFEWHEETDVVVVGFGAAGASAAIEAREQGASVIAIDRFGGGGATAYSGGIIYAGGTRMQREGGYEDDLDEMYKYLSLEWGNSVAEPTLRRYVETSGVNIEWLAGHGIPFDSKVFPEKTIYPPDGYFLYFSGNEKVPGYKEKARPAPRGHRVVGEGFTGEVLYAKMKEAALHHGVKLLTHAPVTRLVMDRNGGVAGVEINELPPEAHTRHESFYGEVVPMKPFNGEKAEKAILECREFEAETGRKKLIRARRGVVLSTGGYGYNLSMLAHHNSFFGEHYRDLLRIGSMGCDGSGIIMGEAAGATTMRMDKVFAGKSIAPPNAFLKGAAVNLNGERFINEETYSGFLGEAISKQHGEKCWLILDSATFWLAVRQALFGGVSLFKNFGLPALLNILLGGTKRARSLNKLAAKCGINKTNLESTVAQCNAAAAGEIGDPFNKSTDNQGSLSKGPFYAINISIANKYGFTLMFTLGGLSVDDDTGLVKTSSGHTIEGLYAAGRTAAGLCSTNYISGTALGDCVFSGRRAGHHAATGTMAHASPATA